MVYYNENDRQTAAWLRELIKAHLIASGDVDDRSIEDVRPSDLRGYTQCHFFAGIGGWSYALRLAGWPDERPVWTGSCPCQPFSQAGLGIGTADARHLWPIFDRLICQCRPPTIFGEQVASKAGLAWLDAVQTDVEASHYAFGAADLCAAGVGAPHRRQRLCWVANRDGERQPWGEERYGSEDESYEPASHRHNVGRRGDDVRLVHAQATFGRPVRSTHARRRPMEVGGSGSAGRLDDVMCLGREAQRDRDLRDDRIFPAPANPVGDWDRVEWLFCQDGKWRPVEPGTFPLAHGLPARVGRLRGYGNAIVPAVAAEFIGAFLDIHG